MRTLPIVVLGAGEVSRALVRRLIERDAWWAGREGFSLRVRGWGESESLFIGAPYIELDGTSLREDGKRASLRSLLREAPSIIVDTTRDPANGTVLVDAVRAGHAVVLSEATALVDAPTIFRLLTADRRTRFDAVFGAPARIAESLEQVIDAGTRVLKISAKLAGGRERALRRALLLSRCLSSDLRLESIRGSSSLGEQSGLLAEITAQSLTVSAISSTITTSSYAIETSAGGWTVEVGEESVESVVSALIGDLLVLAREEEKPWRLDRFRRGSAAP